MLKKLNNDPSMLKKLIKLVYKKFYFPFLFICYVQLADFVFKSSIPVDQICKEIESFFFLKKKKVEEIKSNVCIILVNHIFFF